MQKFFVIKLRTGSVGACFAWVRRYRRNFGFVIRKRVENAWVRLGFEVNFSSIPNLLERFQHDFVLNLTGFLLLKFFFFNGTI